MPRSVCWIRHRVLSICLTLGALILAPTVHAQETTDVHPVGGSDASRSSRAAAVLGKMLSLRLEQVTLQDALDTLSSQAGVTLVYSAAQVPLAKKVSLVAPSIALRDALHALLIGTGLEATVAPSGRVILRPEADANSSSMSRLDQQGTATVSGYVRDSATGASIPRVNVRVDGTAFETISGADGQYKIAGLAAGEYRVVVRRVGYLAKIRTIALTDGQSGVLNFLLNPPATKLDEVVTTALGEQRRYQIGNDISTINADSIAPTAPITSVTDLISARAPGVTVLETSGMTGSGEAIRIEGLTSLVLQNDPILIVDGVRQDNAAGGDLQALGIGVSHPTPSRLNDIDFGDIETIDILKGPSAATEYGTDAANGVIVITTKHGTSGTPQWKASAEQAESNVPERFPEQYYSWGHTPDGTATGVDCQLNAKAPQYGEHGSTAGNCVVDSITEYNPLNQASTSIFGTGHRAKYDLSVGGGSEAVRYFLSGGLSNETGIVRMPPVFKELADTANLGLPSAASDPNGEQQRSVRVNSAIKLSPTVDLTATGSYLSTYQQTPMAQYLYTAVFSQPALRGAANGYGYAYAPYGNTAETPLGTLSDIGLQNTDRVVGGLTANWRPAGWFVGHFVVGLDHGSQLSKDLDYPLSNTTYEFYNAGSLGLVNATNDMYSSDLRGTATAIVARNLRAVTSIGLQIVDSRTVGQSAQTYGVTPSNLTLNGATSPYVTQLGTRQATLGGYGEEQLSIADRLFLTGALRIDGASGFGSAYNIAEYPKASVSWLAISQGPVTVRVRGAFGESGVQPMNGAALQIYTAASAALGSGGDPVSVNQLTWPGNPNLQPERSAEFEGGADIDGWGGRVSLALTGYTKTTHDALVDVDLGQTFNNETYQENIGEVQNTGVEGNITVGVIETPTVIWNVAVNGSLNRNHLASLAPGTVAQTVNGYNAIYEQRVGYPLYGIWSRPIAYRDANHDGIIEPDEESEGDTNQYIGPSLPTREVAVSTHLGLWKSAVTIGGVLDYRGGYYIANDVMYLSSSAGNNPQTNLPTAPLRLQAQGTYFYNSALNDEDGAFVRWRELSLTYAVSRSLARQLRVRNLTITAAARNLALWTRYHGVDPEVTNSNGFNVSYTPTTGGNVLNNDMREDFGAVPLTRNLVIRLNVDF